MKTLQNKEVNEAITNFPMEGLAAYHKEIEKKYTNTNPEEFELSNHTKALMAFNGYYALDNTKGAFFTIDTNMHIKEGASKPIYDVSLIVCMDGKNSQTFPFTGTFDGTTLTQKGQAELSLDVNLTFSRQDNNQGIMASFTGSISLPNKIGTTVSGATYNNPINYEIYAGTYYETVPIGIKNEGKLETTLPVLEIKNNHQLSFDYGSNNGVLKTVPSYTYNLNMYFFSFSKKEETYHLIMGTGAAKGLVTNNMTITTPKVGKPTVASRNLATIPFPDSEKPGVPNLKGSDLAQFSGYYTIPSIHPNAFLSIQAEYTNIDSLDIYAVMISISFDGKTSKGFYFNEGTMNFENNTLTIPTEKISIKFDRTYNETNKSLVTISGSIGSQTVNGYTPFNPVPLAAFGGLAMTATQVKNNKTENLTLEIVNKNEIIYNGVTMKSFIYVPLMYILAYPYDKPTLVMSFGSDGEKGNTCIVTDLTTKPATTSLVYAVHNKS